MKFVNHLSILPLCLIALSCASGHKNMGDNGFDTPFELTTKDSLNIETCGVLAPQYLVAMDDVLWVADDDRSSAMVHLLVAEGKCVAKGISLGEGPNEVLEITSIRRMGNEVQVYDARRGAVSIIERDSSSLRLMPLVSNVRLLDDAVSLPDKRLLTAPISPDYSYALIDSMGSRQDSLKYYPSKPDGVSDFTHALACTGFLAFILESQTYARALVYDGGIDFFQIKEGKLQHSSRYERFGMDYSVIDAGQQLPVPSTSTRIGYKSLTASDHYFYSLFSDKSAAEMANGCLEMQSFASDGTPYRKYLLDRPASKIAVSPNDTRLYTFCDAEEGGTYIFVYDLPQ